MNIKWKIRGIVFGSLYPNKIHIHVGYGIGFMEGGNLLMVEREKVPTDCRMPNTYVWILTEEIGYKNIKIEKMSDSDIEDNIFI
ncbi:hypothetical protein [Flavobacterium sp. HNIBRBA15423]|uniref:hypothetical protein n=1 Tax=Flavobacterium sp. HNIBRBA15423 TaxID=3458683 RepID=UPI004044B80E